MPSNDPLLQIKYLLNISLKKKKKTALHVSLRTPSRAVSQFLSPQSPGLGEEQLSTGFNHAQADPGTDVGLFHNQKEFFAVCGTCDRVPQLV